MLKDKVRYALKNNLKVVFCIGENKIEKKNKKTLFVLKKQLTKVLEKNLIKIILLSLMSLFGQLELEKIPTTNELRKITIHIKKVLRGIFKKSPAVLYGFCRRKQC